MDQWGSTGSTTEPDLATLYPAIAAHVNTLSQCQGFTQTECLGRRKDLLLLAA